MEPSTFNQKLGAVVKGRREYRGFTLKEVACELGIAPQQLCKYESGRNAIPIHRLVILSRLLKLHYATIISKAL